MQDYRIACLIPLRGGSKGIHKKNLVELSGKPLFAWVTEEALITGLDVFITTEDAEIALSASRISPKIKILNRPLSLAQDETSTEAVIDHFLTVHHDVDLCILLQATSPLTEASDILSALELWDKHRRPVVSAVRSHRFLWNDNGYPLNYDPLRRPRRQDWDGQMIENGAIYVFSREQFYSGCSTSRCSPPCSLYEMKPESILEVDTIQDLSLIRKFLES